MNQEEAQYIAQLEAALSQSDNRGNQMAQAASSAFMAQADSNLIEFQLELDNLLESVEHLLRGHEIKFDDKGNQVWKEAEDERNVLFNEYGTQEILRTLKMYLNRNTILSNYDEPTINNKVYDLGMDLTDLIFMKYEEMFELPDKDDKEYKNTIDSKIKLYMILVRAMTDIIHSAYLRALSGGERESLRSARMVTQTQPLMQNVPMGMTMGMTSKKSLFRPSTWFKT